MDTANSHRVVIRWSLPILAIALLSVAGFVYTGGRAHALTNCTVADSEVALNAEEQAFLGLINQYRAQNGRGALTPVTSLNRAAAWHANDMIQKGYFAHNEPGGRTWSTRITHCGYPAGGYRGENIAAGYPSAQAVFNAWKASPGHNANMLNGNFTKIGIGKVGSHWNTDFGSVNDSTSGVGVTSTPTRTPTRTATARAATPTHTATARAATPTRTATAPAATPTRTTTAPAATPTRTATTSPSTVTWTTSATVSSPSRWSTSRNITASVRASKATSAFVALEVFDSSGKRVYQKTWNGQSFSANVTKGFGVTWSPPSPGTYTVKVGVFGSGGSPLLSWNDNAATFTR